LDPGNVGAYNDRGIAYYDIKGYDLAIADYSKAIALDPTYKFAYVNRGNAYRVKENFDLAIADYSKAIELDAKYVNTYKGRGRAYSKKGNYDLAVADFTRAAALAWELVELYKGNEAQRRDLNSNIDTLGDLAFELIVARGFAQALAASDRAISTASEQLWLYTNRAHALMFLNREDEARALYLEYRGAKNVIDKKSWEAAVVEDFVAFRNAGLSHPLMEAIEAEFSMGGIRTMIRRIP
jgi:tetratricopeptide (TPR) repeat protein